MSTRVPPPDERGGNLAGDTWVIAWRGLLHMRRQPEALADVTIQPVTFVLLFAYVFGGAIDVLGGHAVAHLIRALLPIVLMSLCGLVMDWRIRGSLVDAVAGYALMIAFSFAVIWLGVLLGSLLPSPEAIQGVAFAAIFPVGIVAVCAPLAIRAYGRTVTS